MKSLGFYFFLYSCVVCMMAVFVSCSDEVPSVVSVDSRVVFDYSDCMTVPRMHLAVFMQLQGVKTSGTDDGGELRVISPDGTLEWKKTSVLQYGASQSGSWTGTVEFVPAVGNLLPCGTYVLYYTDKAGNTCEGSFSVSYPAELAERDVTVVQERYAKDSQVFTAAYAQDGQLLSFGAAEASAKEARTVRQFYVVNGGSVVCMLPSEYR